MPPTSYPELILFEAGLSFHIMYNHKGPRHVSEDEREPIHTLDHAFQSLDFEGPRLSSTSRARSAPDAVNPEIESDPHVCEYIQRTIVQDVIR